MVSAAPTSFLSRYLDPATLMGELLFGLIMTLTFTLGASLVFTEEGKEGLRQLLIATIGCNVAWGIIDAVLYVLGEVFERGRINRLAHAVKVAQSDAASLQIVASELDQYFEPVTSAAERQTLYMRVVERVRRRVAPPSVTGTDLVRALAVFFLVFVASFPAALPFMLFDDPWIAMRVSNGFLLLMLFIIGYRTALHTMARPWLVGTVMLLGGMALVAVAIALGG